MGIKKIDGYETGDKIETMNNEWVPDLEKAQEEQDKIDAAKKPFHAKPALYAYYFIILQEIAREFGYNLVLHGSMNRDLDLIAIPWVEWAHSHLEMIEKFRLVLKGTYNEGNGNFSPHGRQHFVINLNRGGYQFENGKDQDHTGYIKDPQYYIDISVMPTKEPSLIQKGERTGV